MNYIKGAIIFSALALGAILTVGGISVMIFDAIRPSGYYFESVVATSLGILMLLMVIVANAVGQAIQTFSKVFEKQVEMQEKFAEFMQQKQNSQRGLSPGILGIPGGAFEVDLTGVEPGDISKLVSDIMKKTVSNYAGNKSIDKQIEDLEEQLAKAVKAEDFEKAEEISNLLIKLKDQKNPE